MPIRGGLLVAGVALFAFDASLLQQVIRGGLFVAGRLFRLPQFVDQQVSTGPPNTVQDYEVRTPTRYGEALGGLLHFTLLVGPLGF